MAGVLLCRVLVCLRGAQGLVTVMFRRVLLGLLLLGLQLVAVVHAQVCTGSQVRWRISVGANPLLEGPWKYYVTGPEFAAAKIAACSGLVSQYAQTAVEQFYPPTATTINQHYDTVTNNGVTCSWLAHATQLPDEHEISAYMGAQVNAQAGNVCPPEEHCDVSAPDESFVVSGPVPSESCNPITKCKNVFHSPVCAGGSCIYTQTQTNEDCGPSAPDEEEPPPPGEGCVTSGAVQFCKDGDDDGQGPNCGFLNGNAVCLDQTEHDGCQALGDGSRVCGPEAHTPPVPDNGSPGNPAPPDETFQTTTPAGDTNTWNFYSSSTVAGSGRPPGSGDNPDDGEDDGTGLAGVGGQDGDGTPGSGEDGLHCDPTSDEGCTGEGDGGGPEDDPRSGWQCWAAGDGLAGAVGQCFQNAAQGLYGALVAQSSLVSIANQTADALPAGGGECPTASANIEWLGASFDFWEVPCLFLDDVANVLGPMFLLGWSLLGLRILLTIPGGE